MTDGETISWDATTDQTPTFPQGEEVFDCPDCPTVLYEDSALYGPRSCEECRLHSQGSLSLEELKERKETHGY